MNTLVGIAGIVLLIFLLFSGMPVGFLMALLGFAGFSCVISIKAGLGIVIKDIFGVFSSYNLTVIPLFILMGQVAFHAGIGRRLYDAAYTLSKHLPGGLAIATIGACASFAAICGSTNASAATMTTVALPEMKRYRYDMKLATGTIAAGSSLGIMIPPSVIFIIYGIMTQQSIGKLFVAGIVPGILIALLFIVTIYAWVKLKPGVAPYKQNNSGCAKLDVLIGVAESIFLFLLVMGGLFAGFFTPTEAGAIGAGGAILLSVLRKNLTWSKFIQAVLESTKISCMVLVIVAGATIFGHFLAITRLPFTLANWVTGLPLPHSFIMIIIILLYFVLGCFIDALALILLTIPIFYPVIITMGYNPIWFGVLIVLVTQIGVITPPVGVNVYVVSGIAKGIPLETIFKGAFPFLLSLLICALLLVLFPQISLFLPGLMK